MRGQGLPQFLESRTWTSDGVKDSIKAFPLKWES